jgi:RNA polymerase sigma-70 factor (ECF subfamily)
MSTFNAGDQSKWIEGLVREHLPALRGYLASLGAHSDLTDDLAQDVFLAVLRHPDRYDATRPMRGWLFGIARNLLHQEFRRDRVDARVRQGLAMRELARDNTPPTDSEEILSSDQALVALKLCLEALGQRARRLVDLHYGERVPTHEIAAAVGMGGSAVRMGLLRARETLRGCVGQRIGGLTE